MSLTGRSFHAKRNLTHSRPQEYPIPYPLLDRWSRRGGGVVRARDRKVMGKRLVADFRSPSADAGVRPFCKRGKRKGRTRPTEQAPGRNRMLSSGIIRNKDNYIVRTVQREGENRTAGWLSTRDMRVAGLKITIVHVETFRRGFSFFFSLP